MPEPNESADLRDAGRPGWLACELRTWSIRARPAPCGSSSCATHSRISRRCWAQPAGFRTCRDQPPAGEALNNAPPAVRGEMSRSDRGGSPAPQRVGPLCLRHLPLRRPARKSHCSDLSCRWRCHEVTVGSFRYLVRARPEPPSACGISPRGAGGEGRWGLRAGLLRGRYWEGSSDPASTWSGYERRNRMGCPYTPSRASIQRIPRTEGRGVIRRFRSRRRRSPARASPRRCVRPVRRRAALGVPGVRLIRTGRPTTLWRPVWGMSFSTM